jgi:hypothetical protein
MYLPMRFIKIPTSKKPHIAFLLNIQQKLMLYFPSKLGSGYQILITYVYVSLFVLADNQQA